VRSSRLLHHGELDSVIPEMQDASHRGSGVARRQVDATMVWGRRNAQEFTPETPSNLQSELTHQRSLLRGHRW